MSEGFNQENYDQILALPGDKPIALGEVGKPPTQEILQKQQKQPRWTWFISWGEPVGFWMDRDAFRTFLTLYDCDQTLTLEELPWMQMDKPKIHYPVLK